MKIWQKHLLMKLTGTFFFLLVCIFAVYVIVDLSIHGVQFLSSGAATIGGVTTYYVRHFAMHMELFFPLTLLLAAMKVLFDLNNHRELIALQMAGLSKKKLLLPFFLFAAFLSCICYVNTEWLMPKAQDEVDAFKNMHGKNKKKQKREKVYTISLKDNSELIYQRFDADKNELFDVFWVRAADDVWHMKYLKIDSPNPEGRFADHLVRNRERQFEKRESFERREFPDLPWDEEAILQRFVPLDNRSISNLIQQSFTKSSERKKIAAYLHYKLALPLLPILVLFGICPLSMRFSRTSRVFLLVSCSLFAFVALKTLLDGMLILAENQVLSAPVAIWTPLVLTFAASFRSFAKL